MKNKKQEMLNQLTAAGLDIAKTLTALKTECDKIGVNFEDVNYLDINAYREEKYAYIWIINKTRNKLTNAYDYHYFNDNRAVSVPLYTVGEVEYLTNLLKLNRAKFGQGGLISEGYYFNQVKDNKPSTLEEIKNATQKYFICFIAWDGYQFRTFNTEGKKAVSFELCWLNHISYTYNLSQANETRKEAQKIFALYNTNKENLYEPRAKHVKRKQENKENELTRYSKRKLWTYEYENLRPCYTTYKDTKGNYCYSSISFGGYSLKIPEDVQKLTRLEQQKYIYSKCFDKSNYFILGKQEQLKRRAEQVRKQKEFDYWEKCDKTEYMCKCLENIGNLIRLADTIATPHKILYTSYGLKRLGNIKTQLEENQDMIKCLKEGYYSTFKQFENRFNEINNNYIILLNLCAPSLINSDLKIDNPSEYVIKENKIVCRYDWTHKYNIAEGFALNIKNVEQLQAVRG